MADVPAECFGDAPSAASGWPHPDHGGRSCADSSPLLGLARPAHPAGRPRRLRRRPTGPRGPSSVALGDSYASGVGTGRYREDGSDCRRSSYAYPVLLADARRYDLRFRACSGATIAHVRSTQLRGTERPHPLRHPRSAATIGFAPGTDHLRGAVVADRLRRRRRPGAGGDPRPPARDAPQAVRRRPRPGAPREGRRDRLPADLLRRRLRPGTWFSRREQQRLNRTADLLDARLGRAARDAGFRLRSPGRRFRGHAVCDRGPGSTGCPSRLAESYHPNRAGHARGLVPLVRPLLR